ncbi:MAG TPA: archease [Methanolinea sp.]|nr:archease [Methanolinea sp.]HQK56544.1 archease [Methanolinea sp.]
MSIEELDHTADAKVRVKAGTLEELFSEAGRALMQVMYGRPGKDGRTHPVVVSGDDLESLMHAYLSELLFITEVEGLVISGADLHIGEGIVEGVVMGEPFSMEAHNAGRGVKGISYSGLSIVHDQESYILDVIFDV